ncbi:Sucrose synthase [Sulfitobacter indolifex]|uniref:sucrose-phosphate synthase n=1 Tax=Sulfitobacter indolifex HEL-45 TaxID=391624 RepID=A0ABM9X3F5_9RHOB|nr:HAD family hydrolase [Sulfitobacter indolifex]EDQ03946.1 sucrose-phosphate phosphatase [Sulfitobacter indolifex HEL-45]UOA19487.1 Sucrose synthase [Sulfitobacter indolifex]
MFICHIALGGCLTAPTVNYGVTEDTGGHIAYILGAARAQAARGDVDAVQIVTRAFDDPSLGAVHAQTDQQVGRGLSIRRLWTAERGYLSKENLAAEISALVDAFLADLAQAARRPDVIHAHFADAAHLALAARERFGIPVIYTPHSLALSKSGAVVDTARIEAERRALLEADAVVLSSRDEAEVQVAAYGTGAQARVHRVSPGVSLRRPAGAGAGRAFLADTLSDPDRPMLLAVARPVARKNLATLAKVYADSPALQKRANLVIVAGQHGDALQANPEARAELAQLHEVLGTPHLCGQVALPPRHSQADVAGLYEAAAQTGGVFVNLALHEPFGLTMLEAASHGLPVVATQEGGPADIVADLGHGICVPPRDVEAIEAALLKLLDNRAVWSQAAKAGRAHVGRYDWSKWAEEVQLICEDIRQSKPLRGAPVMLASDIDNTLTGCAPSAALFDAWVRRDRPVFAVATGRSLPEARRILRAWHLPMPRVFITSVGTEVYLPDSQGRLCLDARFARKLDAGWERDRVERALLDFGFNWQARVEQRRWKLSGFGDMRTARRLERHLARRNVAAQIVASHGRLIDVLPLAAGKGAAVCAAARQLGMSMDRVVVAGDSGNDFDMLQAVNDGPGRGILVGNAVDGLRDRLGGGRLYYARASHAAGVLEGLETFGLAPNAMESPVKMVAQ